MTTRNAIVVGVLSLAAYAVLLVLQINVLMPAWVSAFVTVLTVVCLLGIVACFIQVFEQSEQSYHREFGHDR